ncbi:5'-3' exonuclease [Nakamurella sp. UYEF19]|uniref:5'-3' exonuclease n=1 Tax=Nakamurella sp. UYEF19 TaxID=1756392 RepID=UPI00339A62C6
MLQLLDLAGIYFRAFHGVPATTVGPAGQPVNAIRGTLDIVRRVMLDGNPTRVIACLDLDWRPAWRVELVPTYKTHRVAEAPADDNRSETAAKRNESTKARPLHEGETAIEEVPDLLSPQIPVLLEVLAAIGISTAGAPGFEADDVIGTLAGLEREDEVEVVTGDRDLFQLARDAPTVVRVRYVGAGMSRVVVLDMNAVAEKHDIPPGRYPDFAVLRGDPSDGLPGVAGVGDKTAAALISTYGSIEAVIEATKDPKSTLTKSQRQKLAPALDYLAVAPTVVRVAQDAPVTVWPAGDGRLPKAPVDPDRLLELSREYGLSSPVARLLDTLSSRD